MKRPEPPTTTPSGAFPSGRGPIEARLRELRRLVRSSLALRAFSLLAAAAVGLVLLSLAVDRLFRLPLEARAVVQSLLAVVLIVLTWVLFLRPLSRPLRDRALADILERRFPHLLDRLRSALEFSQQVPPVPPPGGEEIQAALKRRVILEACEAARELHPEDVVDTPRVVSAMSVGIISTVLLLVLVLLEFPTLSLWARRNLLFEDVDWPYRTHLEVRGFEAPALERGVPRGDALRLEVVSSGERPERVRIRVQHARETQVANLAREGDGTFVHESAEVTEPFQFTVEGGDYRTPIHRVRVLERPEVTELRVTVDPPAYTGKKQETLTGDLGDLAVPEGSSLRLEGKASKPLQGAGLEVEGGTVSLEVGTGGDPAAFSGIYRPVKGGTLTIHLEDREKVPQNQLFRLLVTPVADRPPTVSCATEGIGSMITPQARIPLRIKANDDYGVVSLGAEYTITSTQAAAAEGGSPPLEGEEAFPPLAETLPAAEISPGWEIEHLGIEPERRLDLRVVAADNDGLHGSKKGRASTLSFLVVTPQRLGEEFLRREEEQRRILEKAVADERLVRDSVYRLIDEAWKGEGPLGEAAVKEMTALGRTERQLARQLTGIAGAMRLLRDEMTNNRLGEREEIDRLVGNVIDPLTDLAERLLPAAANLVGEIRELRAPSERLSRGLTLAGDLESILSSMDAVLAHMRRLEGFTEIVNRLRAVIKVHEESAAEAKRVYDREVQDIFENDTPTGEGGLDVPKESQPRK